MYIVKPLPPQVDASLLALLARAEPATIGHSRHTGFMDPAIRGLFPDVRIAGTAVPIRMPGPDGTILAFAFGQLRRGDVLVIDRCGDHRHACIGGALAYAARELEVAGIIVDGPVTDIGELRQYGVPVWARGLSAVTVKGGLAMGGAFAVPVACGGIAVNPGDAILADENGILVLDPADIEAAAKRALELQEREKGTLERLRNGERLPDITGATTRVMSNLTP